MSIKTPEIRIGIDLGGTKIASVALDDKGNVLFSDRIATPRSNYDATIAAIKGLVNDIERRNNRSSSVGIGTPGSISPHTGLMQNANSTLLNRKPFQKDLEAALRRPVRLANDANCFALSEAVDGAGCGARTVFGVIIGTGCGGGLVHRGRIIDGPRGIGGEWGHNPLPWPELDELPGPRCWCGRRGCMETWISGPALARDHQKHTGQDCTAAEIAALAESGEMSAQNTLDRHASRMARGLAAIVNLFDPDVIILGGGLSNMPHLYKTLPALAAPLIFADDQRIDIRPPRHGDASGVRGAARLWDDHMT